MKDFVIIFLLLYGVSSVSSAAAISGSISSDFRQYPNSPLYAGQNDNSSRLWSLTGDFKLTLEPSRKLKCSFNPYYRAYGYKLDSNIFDIHEAKCVTRGDDWYFKIGYDVEFWGVMEFVNPTNVLNQRDVTYDLVSKRRLGQPMAKFSIPTSIGNLGIYLLDYFQPMKFPNYPTDRLRASLPIDFENPQYSETNGRYHPEFALRLANQDGALSSSIFYFYGYQRDPDLIFGIDNNGVPTLTPYYKIEQQIGLSLQLTKDNFIFKNENILRLDSHGNYSTHALSAGIEYDVPAQNSQSSISLLAEYIYDKRQTTLIVPFTDDLFLGARINLNDEQSTAFTLWSNYNLSSGNAEILAFDASRRVADNLKLIAGLRRILTSKGAFADIQADSYFSLKIKLYL